MVFNYNGRKRKLKNWVIYLLYFIMVIVFTMVIIKNKSTEPKDYPYSYENWTRYVDSIRK